MGPSCTDVAPRLRSGGRVPRRGRAAGPMKLQPGQPMRCRFPLSYGYWSANRNAAIAEPPLPTSPLAQHNPTPGNQGEAGRRHEIAGGCRSPATSPTCGKGNRKIAVPVKLSSMISRAADLRSSAELARSVAAGSIEARRRHSDPATHRSVLDGLSPSWSFLMRGVGPATIFAALAERIGTTPDATGGDR